MDIFDYLNDIGYKKENILKDGDEILEAGYEPYRINKFLLCIYKYSTNLSIVK